MQDAICGQRAATSDRRCPAWPSVSSGAALRGVATTQRRVVRVISRARTCASKGESMPRVVLALLAISIAVTLDVEIAAQTLDQDHGQYSRADVEAGQRLYGPQCQVCHGANGDGVPGIDLKLGRFRRASSDDDLARTITSGVPGTGMPAFVLRPEELVAIVAFIRAGFDPASASVRVGDAARGRALFQGKRAAQGAIASTASALASHPT